MPELKPYKDDIYLWHYVPSKPASAAFLIAFFVSTGGIVHRLIKTRSWFSIPFVIGGLMEAVGFATRALCTDRTDELALFAVQFILILVAPALFAASVYMALSRLMRKLKAESQPIISARWLTRLFVFGDVLSFIIQLGGGAIATNPDSDPQVAKWTILVGLVLQIAFFAFFIVTALIFHKRMTTWQPLNSLDGNVNWVAVLYMLYAVSGLVMMRSIFRVIEYAMGMDSYLFKNEWPIYVFDAAFMLIAAMIWGLFHPGELSVTDHGKLADIEEIPM
ncbi:Protein RTM1 [Paramyrothecium foliicola]|nr:Protein RTM1 [Paramyrothecium foliicola]